jgi:hypothetical protein
MHGAVHDMLHMDRNDWLSLHPHQHVSHLLLQQLANLAAQLVQLKEQAGTP